MTNVGIASQESSFAPQVGAAMFLHNMRALWRVDPLLAMRVDAVDDEGRFALEPTRSGSWTVGMRAPGGEQLLLHSRYDPESEALRFAETVPIEDKFCFVVNGLGLGYHVRALFERLRGDVLIVCTEPSIALIATALTCLDFVELLDSGRFVILTDDDKARLHDRLSPFNTLMMLGTQLVRHPPSIRVAEAAHSVIHHAIAEFASYTRMTLMTLVANSKKTCRNIAMNLPTYVTTPSIDELRDRFAGRPGVVISAGPSLRRNIDQLQEWKGRAPLIAVQTALKPLAQRGILPDFVASLDFHEMSRKFFETVEGLENVHLVAEPKATWHVVDCFPGPISLLDNSWARLVVGEELGARAGLKAGATVAHLAFYLAAYMGCDPIILVGQDLAYTGHVFYTPGVEIHQAWRGELNRFNTMEQKEWERIVRNRPILRRVPGNEGGELYTDDLLFTYLEQFEKDIAAVPQRVINATEGGARIRGTQVMTLRDARDRVCAGAPCSPPQHGSSPRRLRDLTKLAPARCELEKRLAELNSAVAVCDELLIILEELKGMTHDAARFNQRLARVDELRARISQESRAYQIINAATQLAEFRRFSADRRLSLTETDEAERATRQITRDVEFISSVREGAVDVRSILQTAVERVSEAHATAESRC